MLRFQLFIISALLSVESIFAQYTIEESPAYNLNQHVPAGNYSGITHLGNNLYAVVDDKASYDGFHVWEIMVDSESGKVKDIKNKGFRHSSQPNRDCEGCAFIPEYNTILISGEKDNCLVEYNTDGTTTGRRTRNLLPGASSNAGLESLTYDRNTKHIWTMEESSVNGQLRLIGLDTKLNILSQRIYQLSSPSKQQYNGNHIHGVSALCAIGDSCGTLLVLEREAYIPKSKIGAWTKIKLFAFYPEKRPDDPTSGRKTLLWEHTTQMNLFQHKFANYEGMCLGPRLADGSIVLFLICDSQNRYAGVLKDYLKTLILR